MVLSQKQMGAYYTQEDIARYMSKNTLIPCIFDRAEQKCPAAFAAHGPIWSLLREKPDRYIYAALKKGCALALPSTIEIGIQDVAQRTAWNKAAPEVYALPLETWREVVARRQRYSVIKACLCAGEARSIDDLITWNLDICLFARDVIASCEEIELLHAFYTSLERLTILDPTCGAGAFLCAALAILESLYEACLERMQYMIEWQDGRVEPGLARQNSGCPDPDGFRKLLQEVEREPTRQYFIRKSIVARNLYGVDIMPEAAENCRDHLLALVSQVAMDAGDHVSPALACNIRTGNALVGFAISDAPMQSTSCADAWRAELDGSLAARYGLDLERMPEDYAERFALWRLHHRPFHWCLEFPEIQQRGGFDIILGNPPYVAYSKIKATYQLPFYETLSCGNLSAYTLERAATLLRAGGRCGMIVPVSMISSQSYRSLKRFLFQRRAWISSYSNRPGKLFANVEQRLAILLLRDALPAALFTSAYQHWYGPEREHLFDRLAYTAASTWSPTGMPLKSGSVLAEVIFARLNRHQGCPLLHYSRPGATVVVHNGPTYWVRALPFEPNIGYKSPRSNHYSKILVGSQTDAFLLTAVLSSSTFYFFYKMVGNCRDLGRKELRFFPLGNLAPGVVAKLTNLGRLLAERLKGTAVHCSRRYPSGVIAYEEYYPARAKEILDEIDRVLAEHYELSAEELDFILNYEIKYRKGRERYSFSKPPP